MVQLLQVWSPVTIYDPSGNVVGSIPTESEFIKSIVAEAGGGYTLIWDEGSQIFDTGFSDTAIDTSSLTFNAFGVPTGDFRNGVFMTGIVEWGGEVDEVFRTADQYIYVNHSGRYKGSDVGGPFVIDIVAARVPVTLDGFADSINGFGSDFMAQDLTTPDRALFSSDSVLLSGDVLATVATFDSLGFPGAIFPPEPPLPSKAVLYLQAADGSNAGSLQLSTNIGPDMKEAAVAGLGNTAVAGFWSEENGDGSGFGIIGQRADLATATALGGNTVINQNTAGDQDQASAVRMADGNVAIAWRDASGAGGDASGTAIKFRIMRPDGTFATNEVLINATTAGNQSDPRVVALNINQVLVIWADDSTGARQLRGIVVDFAGSAVTSELLIASGAATSDIRNLMAVKLEDGRVVVAWYNPADGGNSFSTILDPRPAVIFGSDAGETILGHQTTFDTIVGLAGNDTIWTFTGTVHGGLGNDTIYGGAGNNELNGNEDDDTIYGDVFSTQTGDDLIRGGAGSDSVFGGNGNDTLFGDGDNDIVLGGNGNDTAYGGDGDDQVQGEAGDDRLFGGTGNDTMLGGANNDTAYGDDGNDTIFGGEGNDKLYGMAGLDTLYGDDGNDTMLGGEGNDKLYGLVGLDTLYGEAGDDLLLGGADPDRLFGGTGIDRLFGEDGNDTLRGGDDGDFIYGGADNDALYGENGNDQLFPGTGGDNIWTGSGADRVYFETGAGVDALRDFSNGVDRIVMQGIAGVASFADLVIANGAGYAAVTYAGNTLIITGISAAQLDASDFIFA